MELDLGEKVELIIGRETDLGFNVVIKDKRFARTGIFFT